MVKEIKAAVARLRDKLGSVRKKLERGWIQGNFTGRRGEYCLVGAINSVTGANLQRECPPSVFRKTFIPRTHREKLLLAVWRAIKREYPHATSIEGWNDSPTTSKDDVLHVVDLAEKELKTLS